MTIATISGTVTSQVTVDAGNYAAQLTITNTGLINAGTAGVALLANDPAGPVTVQNDGTIRTIGTQYSAAVLNGGVILLRNNGVIDGATGVYVGVGASLVNAGLITYSGTAASTGVVVNNDGGLDNRGTIAGYTGIASALGGTILNSGIIRGQQTGVALDAALFDNSGTVSGLQTGVSIGVPGASIIDSGTISGGLLDRYGQLGLTLLPGAALYGAVDDLAGDGTLLLAGTTAGIANLENFTGFSQISIATGSQWVVDGFTATAAYYAAGGGLTLSNDAAGTTLFLNGLGPVTYASNTASIGGVTLNGEGILLNSGTIAGESNAAVLGGGGSLVNSGTIIAAGLFLGHGGPGYNNAGTYGGVAVTAGAAITIENSGTIAGAQYGLLLQAGGSIVNAGTIAGTGQSGTRITYTYDPPSRSSTSYDKPGVAIQNIAGALNLTADPGAVFDGAVIDTAGNGALTLASGTAALDIGGFSGFSNIDFAANSHWTLEGDASQLTQGETIAGLTAGDTIILDGFAATVGRYYGGFGLVLSNGSAFPMLHVSAGATAFDVSTDGTDTTITAACFCRGTRIATPQGEVPVEELRIGDAVLTLHAGAKRIKWLGRRSYAAPFADGDFIRPLRIRPGALGEDNPKRALHLSPGHALFLGGALVPGWRLLNGASVTQAAHAELVEYYHIELDAQEVIFADGCPVESYIGAALRGQFHNAAEFSHLYPDAEDQAPCLTLLEEGFALQAVYAQVAARAGLPPAPPHAPGPLRGFVDVAGPQNVEGWAQDAAAPEVPVALDILRNGRRIGRVLANRYRADLRTAGLGSGCHAFRFALPPGAGELTVTRTADGIALPLTDAATKAA